MYSSLANVSVRVANEQDWKDCPVMEMTARQDQGEAKGKLVCPRLQFAFSGLEPTKHYQVWLSLERHDNFYYTFKVNKEEWEVSTVRKPRKGHAYKLIEHSSGVQTGAQWMEAAILFDEVRITNQEDNADLENMLLVTPHHKYEAVITIKDVLHPWDVKRIIVPLAQFIAVTGYKSEKVRKWKAEHNQFVPNDIKLMATEEKPSKRSKRKASDDTVDAPVAKRTPLAQKQSPQPTNQVVQVPQSLPQAPLAQPQYIAPDNFPMAHNPYPSLPPPSSFNDYSQFSNHYNLQNDFSYNYDPTVHQPFYHHPIVPQPQFPVDHNENFHHPHFSPSDSSFFFQPSVQNEIDQLFC